MHIWRLFTGHRHRNTSTLLGRIFSLLWGPLLVLVFLGSSSSSRFLYFPIHGLQKLDCSSFRYTYLPTFRLFYLSIFSSGGDREPSVWIGLDALHFPGLGDTHTIKWQKMFTWYWCHNSGADASPATKRNDSKMIVRIGAKIIKKSHGVLQYCSVTRFE